MAAAQLKRVYEPPVGSFEENHAEFECGLAEPLDQKDSNVRVLKHCRFEAQEDRCRVLCEFEGG